jgi:hypothetical protein
MAYIYAIWRLVSECITGLKLDTFHGVYVVLHTFVASQYQATLGQYLAVPHLSEPVKLTLH